MSTFSDDFKHIVGTVAPTVATALGGPLAGMAVSALTKALGLSSTTSQADLEKTVLAADPAALAQIKVAEIDLQKTMAELGIQEESLAYADVDSARKREESVKDNTPSILAYFLTAAIVALIFALFHYDIPADNKNVMFSITGTVVGTWGMAMGYYFGSSFQSSQKTAGLVSAVTSAAKK
jgi:VIT1/CCC1 family predicted Fe2+/Mn2+ transporter